MSPVPGFLSLGITHCFAACTLVASPVPGILSPGRTHYFTARYSDTLQVFGRRRPRRRSCVDPPHTSSPLYSPPRSFCELGMPALVAALPAAVFIILFLLPFSCLQPLVRFSWSPTYSLGRDVLALLPRCCRNLLSRRAIGNWECLRWVDSYTPLFVGHCSTKSE